MNRVFRVFSFALPLAFLASLAVFSLAPHQAAAAGPCKVGIYGVANEASLTDVQSKLNSTGLFTQVDIHDASTYTPTVAELQQYNAVLVFSSDSFTDSTALGDVLANYADAGGGVVVAYPIPGFNFLDLSGRILSDGYLPFTQGLQSIGSSLTLIPDVPAHPILAGVSSFDGGTASFREDVSLTDGAFQVAHWSNDTPLVATKQLTTGKIVGLNFYPPSSDVNPGLWIATTDGALLMANSLVWAGNCIIEETSGVVGIYGADFSTWLRDVQSKLGGTGLFTRVDLHDARYYTPSLGELQQYSAVLVYRQLSFYDSTALGDVLANYADDGGGVVVATFAFNSAGLGGRIASGGYLPFTTGANTSGTPLTLIPDVPAHPILAGVNSFDGGSSSYHETVSPTDDAFQVAHWSNDIPLVATIQPTAGKIVGLNFYPPSSDAQADLWTATTDGACC